MKSVIMAIVRWVRDVYHAVNRIHPDLIKNDPAYKQGYKDGRAGYIKDLLRTGVEFSKRHDALRSGDFYLHDKLDSLQMALMNHPGDYKLIIPDDVDLRDGSLEWHKIAKRFDGDVIPDGYQLVTVMLGTTVHTADGRLDPKFWAFPRYGRRGG